jgi:hypothetical protein
MRPHFDGSSSSWGGRKSGLCWAASHSLWWRYCTGRQHGSCKSSRNTWWSRNQYVHAHEHTHTHLWFCAQFFLHLLWDSCTSLWDLDQDPLCLVCIQNCWGGFCATNYILVVAAVAVDFDDGWTDFEIPEISCLINMFFFTVVCGFGCLQD